MTLTEYLDPARFQLTTRAGLSPWQQVVADAKGVVRRSADRYLKRIGGG